MLAVPIFAAAIVSASLVPAAAQVPSLSEAFKAEETRNADFKSLLEAIENPRERERLASQLRALIAAGGVEDEAADVPGFGARVIVILAERVREASDQFSLLAAAVRDIDGVYDWFSIQWTDPAARQFWMRLIVKLVVIATSAAIASAVAHLLLRRPRRVIESKEMDSRLLRAVFLVARTVVDLAPLAVFGAVAYLVLPLTEPARAVRLIGTAFINAYLIAGVVMVVARMVLVPRVTGLRMIVAGDETANYLFIWSRRFSFVWIYGAFLAQAAHFLGVPGDGQRLWLNFVGLFLTGMAVIFILQNRRTFAEFLRGDGPRDQGGPFGTFRNRVADIWHALAIIYVVCIFAIWALHIGDGFENFLRASVLTALVVVAVAVSSHGIRRGVRRGFSIGEDLRHRLPTLEARANRYLPVLDVTLRVVLYVVALAILLNIWGFDVVGWLTEPAGRRFLSGTVSIAIVIVGALVFWEAASAAIERYLEKASGDTTALARRARARTLLPLLRNFLFLVMAVMVVLVVLAEIGINIGPLLAGAGIVGLAIGFGSQKLVQDFITGAFILFEDAVAVGDVVRVANIAGLVEAISLRSIRLRDLSGNVHTIPFSAVDTVTNMTKIFSFYVFEVGIAYRENVDQVIEILRDLGEEMREDPDFGPKILAPLEVLGVDAFADSAVIIKARFKTRPIEQWVVGREFNRRMKNRFDELGIEIPFPHRTIYMGELKDGTAPPLNVRASGPGPLPVTPVGPVGEDTPPPSRAPSGSGQTDQGGE